MMTMSQSRMTRPKEMSRYLFTMAATMSVPPVAAAENGSNDARHEGLVLQQVHLVAQVGEKRQKQGQHAYGIYRLQAEAETKHLERSQQQEGVDTKVAHGYRNPRTPIQQGGDTRNATCGDVVGKQEQRPSHAICHHADGYHHILEKLGIQDFFSRRFPQCCRIVVVEHGLIFYAAKPDGIIRNGNITSTLSTCLVSACTACIVKGS